MGTPKLKEVYVSRIRSVLEYACQSWTPGLTQQHILDIKQVQSALFIIDLYLSYNEFLADLSIPNSYVRLCYDNIKDSLTPLHYLFLCALGYNCRQFKQRVAKLTRTERADGSCITYE